LVLPPETDRCSFLKKKSQRFAENGETSLECVQQQVRLLVDGITLKKRYPVSRRDQFGRRPCRPPFLTSAEWMKKKQRECIKFGNLVMEGRDIGSNVFPRPISNFTSTPVSRNVPRAAKPKVSERTLPRAINATVSGRRSLMVPLGATVINNSGMTAAETSKRLQCRDFLVKPRMLQPFRIAR